MDSELQPIYDGIIDGDRDAVTKYVQEAVDAGLPAEVILKQGLVPAMSEVGRMFEEGEYYVPEMLIAARAMQSGLAILKPLLIASDVQATGKVVIGTVQGDLHDIGKNLVGMMLEGAGFDLVDLGTDVQADQFVQAVRDHQPDVVAMSALLTTTMPSMKKTIDALNQAGVRDSVKVIIGGAPVTGEYATDIGADGFGADASRAASLANELVG
ncbi:MAG: cobalamin-binding protein [Desulfuromonadales bacterium]|nr:cobalamin-binding protein [Desulfuromonadales bacterium]